MLSDLPLLEFIPALRADLGGIKVLAPYHLAPWCGMLERALTEPVRGLCAIPIRHNKSWTTWFGIVWLLLHNPTLRFLILCGTAARALDVGKDVRDLATLAGVGPTRGQNTIADWANDRGGGVIVMSAEQTRLGYDVDILIVDDPFASQVEADKPEVRNAVDNVISFYTSRVGRPGRPGSVLCIMSPLHPDDVIGRRRRRTAVTWEFVHAQAIVDEGLPTERAFAPHVRTLEELKQIRAELRETDPTERTWRAQFMCEPTGRSGDLFRGVTRYESLPEYGGFRVVEGVDLAYSVGKRADWFGRVVLRVYGKQRYVMAVERDKIDFDSIATKLRQSQADHGRHSVFSYMSGPEVGYVHLLAQSGVHVQPMPARYNKHVRAQGTIAAWNDGRVLVPQDAKYDGFLARLSIFRGIEADEDDDEVDALVSAFDGAASSGLAVPHTLGQRRV